MESPELQKLREQESGGLVRELWLFVRETGKWWLVPLLLVLLLLTGLALFSGTVYAPLIYTLF